MRFKLIFIISIFVLGISVSEAQNLNTQIDFSKPKPETIWEMAKYDTEYTFKSVTHAFTRPLSWEKKDFTKFIVLVGSTAALTYIDEPIRDFAQNQKDGFPGVVRDFGWYFGSPQNYFIANAGLYSFGLFTKNENIRRVSVLIISSSLTTGLIQTFTKNAVGRARPETGEGHLTFKPFANDSGYRSFPSGHTILSVTMAHSIAKQFENPWVKAGIYTIGAIPPISRLIDDAHWFTDIAFSTVLSIFVVDAIDKFLFDEKIYDYPVKEKRITWNLSIGPNKIGFVGTF
ncbi:phosphatase PAP2 family protein [Winogradskyella sp. A2]|uniref:phosphatase PAP2 family protein n=1 Tax=Winogradskyella sp. A2 TaxID=3366944 RepID=UPI00398C80E9